MKSYLEASLGVQNLAVGNTHSAASSYSSSPFIAIEASITPSSCKMDYWVAKVHIFLVVGISLTSFASFGSSFPNEVGGFNSNFGSNDPNFEPLPCFEKYIMSSYFKKHDSLLDPNFKYFMVRELPLSLGEASQRDLGPLLRVSALKRFLIGEGSHRRLFSSIEINIEPEPIFFIHKHLCELIIIERLPPGVFADPFELERLLQNGGFMDAAVFGDKNLESPTILSNQSLVEVHVNIGLDVLTQKKSLKINVELPLHARYPPLGGSGYVKIEFDEPTLIMRCSEGGALHNQSCFQMLQETSAGPVYTVVWQIPSGIRAHTGVVSLLTFISASISAVLIILTSIWHSDTRLQENSKQS